NLPLLLAEKTGKTVAVIGGGISGLSTAWQLWMKGHEPCIYESRDELGGKLTAQVPKSRIPDEVVRYELSRLKENLCQVNLRNNLTREDFQRIREKFDFVVIAIGAQRPRLMNIPGAERALSALDFLQQSKRDRTRVGERVVIIGAGNVGCDAAAEAGRLGAREITLIDIQEPASFGKERQAALAAGARFLYPKFAKAITDEGVELTDGEILPADTVIVSIGDLPVLDFLTEDIVTERGFIRVDENYRTSDPRVFAVGDVVRPGLLTDAIGAGRRAAETIDGLLGDRPVILDQLPPLDRARVKMEYFDPRLAGFKDIDACALNCASCGGCRDCHVCETICPQNAISRQDREGLAGHRPGHRH
ncbi:MAG: FAD-dependent oxidoreductase, partial [Smithellaceae bacterium]|nr:FAD-dependent oxidoreductase [Smithellaceae bacterium]